MITEITEKLNKFFEEHGEILFAILFGSIAKGTANKWVKIRLKTIQTFVSLSLILPALQFSLRKYKILGSLE